MFLPHHDSAIVRSNLSYFWSHRHPVNDIHWCSKMADRVTPADGNTEREVTLERSSSPNDPGGVWYYTKAAGMSVYNGKYHLRVE